MCTYYNIGISTPFFLRAGYPGTSAVAPAAGIRKRALQLVQKRRILQDAPPFFHGGPVRVEDHRRVERRDAEGPRPAVLRPLRVKMLRLRHHHVPHEEAGGDEPGVPRRAGPHGHEDDEQERMRVFTRQQTVQAVGECADDALAEGRVRLEAPPQRFAGAAGVPEEAAGAPEKPVQLECPEKGRVPAVERGREALRPTAQARQEDVQDGPR
mmetsp:Transcript_30113/g.46577  ORF Transcript_30113/g.46577 Transcript_30113/m.46577 type:complete len:211 (-) Transcript_30113:4-636(-)